MQVDARALMKAIERPLLLKLEVRFGSGSAIRRQAGTGQKETVAGTT